MRCSIFTAEITSSCYGDDRGDTTDELYSHVEWEPPSSLAERSAVSGNKDAEGKK
jgi:hypothetical protein